MAPIVYFDAPPPDGRSLGVVASYEGFSPAEAIVIIQSWTCVPGRHPIYPTVHDRPARVIYAPRAAPFTLPPAALSAGLLQLDPGHRLLGPAAFLRSGHTHYRLFHAARLWDRMRSAGLLSRPVASTLRFELMALVAGQSPASFPLDRHPPPSFRADTASRFEVSRLMEQRLNVASLGEVRDIQAFHPMLRPPFHAGEASSAVIDPTRDAPAPPYDEAATPYFDPLTIADLADAQRGLAEAAQAITGAQPRLPRPIRDFAASVAEWASVVGELLDPPEPESDSDDSDAA